MKQRTIKQVLTLSGVGIHSGQNTQIKISPAPANSGIVFIKKGRRIPALVDQVVETKRSTRLNGLAVTEHLLAALLGLGIDNLEVETEGEELPILDGSSLPFAQALETAGIVEQNKLKNTLVLERPIKIVEAEASLEVLPYNGFKVNFMVDFPIVGPQELSLRLSPQAFIREIAAARTFGYIDEYELLKEQGLARGASLDNALVIGKDGYINTPRWPDELVRHKILDLLGDLALLGRPLQAEIKAKKSGHKLNIELVRRLMKK